MKAVDDRRAAMVREDRHRKHIAEARSRQKRIMRSVEESLDAMDRACPCWTRPARDDRAARPAWRPGR